MIKVEILFGAIGSRAKLGAAKAKQPQNLLQLKFLGGAATSTDSFVIPERRNSRIPEFRSDVPNLKKRVLSLCLENQYTVV